MFSQKKKKEKIKMHLTGSQDVHDDYSEVDLFHIYHGQGQVGEWSLV